MVLFRVRHKKKCQANGETCLYQILQKNCFVIETFLHEKDFFWRYNFFSQNYAFLKVFNARQPIASKIGKRGGLAKRSQGMKNTLLSHEILTHDLLHDMKLHTTCALKYSVKQNKLLWKEEEFL